MTPVDWSAVGNAVVALIVGGSAALSHRRIRSVKRGAQGIDVKLGGIERKLGEIEDACKTMASTQARFDIDIDRLYTLLGRVLNKRGERLRHDD